MFFTATATPRSTRSASGQLAASSRGPPSPAAPRGRRRPARGTGPRAALRGVDREAQLARDLGGGEELPRERLRPLAVELRLRGVVRALEVVGERPQHLRRALAGAAAGPPPPPPAGGPP